MFLVLLTLNVGQRKLLSQDHKAIPSLSSSSSLLCCLGSTSSFSLKSIDVRVKLRFSLEPNSRCDGLYWVIRLHSSRLSFILSNESVRQTMDINKRLD